MLKLLVGVFAVFFHVFYFVVACYGDWLTLDDPAIRLFLHKSHLGMANSSVDLLLSYGDINICCIPLESC